MIFQSYPSKVRDEKAKEWTVGEILGNILGSMGERWESIGESWDFFWEDHLYIKRLAGHDPRTKCKVK